MHTDGGSNQMAKRAGDEQDKENGQPAKRLFVCEYAGCGKKFQRKEHLNRHSLNHNPRTTYNCERCTKVFYRKDLYRRHIDRHNKGMWFRRTGNLPGHETSNKTETSPNAGSTPPIGVMNNNSNNSHQPSPQGSIKSENSISPQNYLTPLLPQNNANNEQPSSPFSLISQPPTTSTTASTSPMQQQQHQQQQQPLPPSLPPPPPLTHHHPPPHHPHHYQQIPPALPLSTNGGSPSMPPLYTGAYFQDSDLGWLFENMDQFGSDQNENDGGRPPQILSEYVPSPERPDEDTIWHTVVQKVLKCLFDKKSESASSSPLDACTLSNSYSSELLNSWISDPVLMKKHFLNYFDVYHDHFPIVHKPTFMQRPDKVHPLLMISMVTLGTAFAAQEYYTVSVKLHERLRWLVFSYNELVNPPLWMFQALILLEAFEKMLSTRTHHELASTFHGAMVILMRRNQPFSFDLDDDDSSDESLMNGSKPSTNKYTLETKWHRWIENESLRRVFYLAFIIDSQHVALFGHSQCMSANEILFELPCLEDVWNAPDAQSWFSRYEMTSRPPRFLDAIKSLLMLKPLDATTSQFSRLIMLHGLYSVASQMQSQKSSSIGFVSGRSNDACKNCGKVQQNNDQWRTILSHAIQTWSFSLFTQGSIIIDVCQSLHQMAYVSLYLSHATILDILIYGRYASLVGRKMTRRDYAKAERQVRAWATSQEALISVKHALSLIQDTLFPKSMKYGHSVRQTNIYEASADKIALRPWCLFVCTLVVYAFHSTHANGYQAKLPANCANQADTLVMAEHYLSSRIRAITSPYPVDAFVTMNQTEQENIMCLLRAVQTSLVNCRWQMMEHAFSCLGGLIYT